ncbi:MFS transporter [Streptomyces laurentii]|uniref:MFS transporter n=1 Tax=Streptomyces laurentii TaxID=39478 RepID=UPI00367E66A0
MQLLGEDLGVAEGAAGLTLTLTGLVAAVFAPLLTPALGRFDRRPVLCGLMAVLSAGNLLAAWSPHFAVMMAARVLVGASMGGVWALAAGLAVRLVPGRSVGPVTSLIFSGIAGPVIGSLLLVYGVAGVLGNFASGAAAARSPRGALVAIGLVLAATVALMPLVGGSVVTAAVLLAVWGLSYGGVSVATQTWLLAAAPEAREAASALFVGVFNGSIALGALLGGQTADGFGVEAVLYLGAALAAGGLAVTALGRAPSGGAR